MSYLFLVSFFNVGISSQIRIQESGGGIKRPGENLQLTCSVSGFALTSYSMNWVRQPPGKGLDWMTVIGSSGDIYYHPALQNRATLSRDTSKSQVSLQLRALKPEDTALYYCARYKPSIHSDKTPLSGTIKTAVPSTQDAIVQLLGESHTSEAHA